MRRLDYNFYEKKKTDSLYKPTTLKIYAQMLRTGASLVVLHASALMWGERLYALLSPRL